MTVSYSFIGFEAFSRSEFHRYPPTVGFVSHPQPYLAFSYPFATPLPPFIPSSLISAVVPQIPF